MPYAIDEEKMSTLKVMDIGKPPVKEIPFMEFPKVVYLHPKDKTKEHKSLIVKDRNEQKAALAKGYRLDAHIPVNPNPEINADEYETA